MRRSTRILTLVVTVLISAAVGAGCGGSDSSGSAGGSHAAKRTCGATKDGNLQIVRHCGDASGSITYHGVTTQLAHGACANTANSIVVNLGESVVDPSPSKHKLQGHDYLGILAGQQPAAGRDATPTRTDGTFTEGVLVSAVVHGTTIALPKATLVLEHGRTSGTFSGVTTDGAKVTGAFGC